MRSTIGFYFSSLLFLAILLPNGLTAQQAEYHFTVLHTNDEHSNLISHPAVDHHPDYENPALGGFARLASAVRQIRDEKSNSNEPVLLFSGGDILGGPAFSWLSLKGLAPELSLMQEIGYDAVTIGNHEFDYGDDRLADYLEHAGYPAASEQTAILGTNTIPPQGHPLSELGIRKTMVKQLENGLTVGIFGLIGEDAISKTAFPGPVEFNNPIDAARQAVQTLREENVDIIISVNHSGVQEDRQLAREVPGIHLIVGGHSHTPLYEPIMEGSTIIVQAGSYTQYLGKIELSYHKDIDQLTIRDSPQDQPYLIPMDHTVEPDPGIRQIVEDYETLLNSWVEELTDHRISDIRQVIAHSDFELMAGPPFRETNLGNFIADAMRITAEEVLGKPVTVGIQANGAIRSSVNPGNMEWSEGDISFYDLITSTGLGSGPDGKPGYPLISTYLTGKELKRVMEVSILLSRLLGDNYYLQLSGLRMEYDPDRAILMRIPFSGTPIPTSMSVSNATFNSGSGIQGNDDLVPVEAYPDSLFHIVTDYYIASFIPMVGEILPNLEIELKNREGEPADLDELIAYENGEEFKVWQAVLRYAMMHSGHEGVSVIPEEYREAGDRLVIKKKTPLWVWPLVGIFFLITLIIYIRKRPLSG